MNRTDDFVNVAIQLGDGRIALGRVPVLDRKEVEQLYQELGKVLRAPIAASVLPNGLKVTP